MLTNYIESAAGNGVNTINALTKNTISRGFNQKLSWQF